MRLDRSAACLTDVTPRGSQARVKTLRSSRLGDSHSFCMATTEVLNALPSNLSVEAPLQQGNLRPCGLFAAPDDASLILIHPLVMQRGNLFGDDPDQEGEQ